MDTLLLYFHIFVCLFVLRLNIPVNNFSVMSGWSHRFLGITSTFGETFIFELLCDKSKFWGFRPSEDSDQPGYPKVLSGTSLCAEWIVRGLSFLHGNREDSDQTGPKPRPI